MKIYITTKEMECPDEYTAHLAFNANGEEGYFFEKNYAPYNMYFMSFDKYVDDIDMNYNVLQNEIATYKDKYADVAEIKIRHFIKFDNVRQMQIYRYAKYMAERQKTLMGKIGRFFRYSLFMLNYFYNYVCIWFVFCKIKRVIKGKLQAK